MTTDLAAADFDSIAEVPAGTHELTFPVRGLKCQSCAHHVEGALESVRGVASARVDLAAALAIVRFDISLVNFGMLQNAVEAVGYVAVDPLAVGHDLSREDHTLPMSTLSSYFSAGATIIGFLASALLLGFYFVVMTVAQGAGAAVGLLEEDWYLIAPLVVGFGVQVGLFARMRQLQAGANDRPASTVVGTSGGISGLSMLACCTHHLADLLPFLGLSGLAIFLGEYRQTIMVLGIASNLFGIAFMLRHLKRCLELA